MYKCLYIGDTIYDYKVASAMGVNCILITKGHNSKIRLLQTGAHTIDQFDEIII